MWREVTRLDVLIFNAVVFYFRLADVDPYTQRPIVNPVRNPVCGHVYDRDSIKAMAAQSKRGVK